MRHSRGGILRAQIEWLDLSGYLFLNLRHGGSEKQRPEQRYRRRRVSRSDHCPYLIGKTVIRYRRAGPMIEGQKVQ
jgi:hypothetical protein